MITQSDLLEITYDMCRPFGVSEMYMGGMFPEEPIQTERIVILAGRIIDGSRWDRSSVRVNWCVPDINGKPDLIRLKAVEGLLRETFSRGAGKVGSCTYKWRRESTETVDTPSLKVHYANLTIKYELLNTN